MTKKPRIGILTEYYNSVNYGGNLQAYALVRYLNEHGAYAEQIQYNTSKNNKLSLKQRIHKYNLSKLLVKLVQKILLKPIHDISIKIGTKHHIVEMQKLQKRNRFISEFNQKIPHCKNVFTDLTIHECNKLYDIFITGSDQVWNSIDRQSYFLSFVEKNKIKCSYAASISKNSLKDYEIDFFKDALIDYQKISVREKETAEMLSDLTTRKIEWVVDPVFLLSENIWKKICTPKLVQESYVFCYFLGDTKWHRNVATHYAKKRNLKIVTLPYLLGQYRSCDANFGQERLFEVKPEDFISLIRYAKCVITDSFHASAFSVIFENEFFVFERQVSVSMGTRIRSLMELTGIQERYYMTEKEALEHMMKLSEYKNTINKKLLNEMIKKSENFIKDAIKI